MSYLLFTSITFCLTSFLNAAFADSKSQGCTESEKYLLIPHWEGPTISAGAENQSAHRQITF